MSTNVLTIRELLDQLRTYANRLKPFYTLPHVVEAAVQILEHDLPVARRELEDLRARIDHLQGTLPDVEAVTAEATARVAAIQEEVAAAEVVGQTRIGAAEQAALNRMTALDAEWAAKQVDLEEEYTRRREALTTQIESLELQCADLTREVAAHREKFAAFVKP